MTPDEYQKKIIPLKNELEGKIRQMLQDFEDEHQVALVVWIPDKERKFYYEELTQDSFVDYWKLMMYSIPRMKDAP